MLTNIQIVVEQLKAHNIRLIVISPGGTNIPLIKMIQDDSFFKCFSIVDERSAMYFAIGLHLQTGEIVATSCTSAQATRNYIPGLTEAYYKQIPILAITMSKHPRFNYQDYMQAPDQTSLPKDCVKESFSLPYIADVNDAYQSIRLVNDAILKLTHHGNGPVQLNIPHLDFPIDDNNLFNKVIHRYDEKNDGKLNPISKKILIIAGEHRPYTICEQNAILKFCQFYNCAIYCNNLSNLHLEYSVFGNLLLSTISLDNFEKSLLPDIIITIGGQTGDYPLYKLLSKPDFNDKLVHWSVREDGNLVDTYDKLSLIFEDSILSFFSHFDYTEKSSSQYLNIWQQFLSKQKRDIDLPLSNTFCAQQLYRFLPNGSIVNFAILNSLRNWNLFPLDASITCYSNVAAFGIDGDTSMFLGESVLTDNLCFLITGDLAFFYDMNALGIRHIKNNVRILLVNNNGGFEFKLGVGENASIDRYIAAAGHFKNAKGWAETCDFEYIKASSKEEFLNVKGLFLGDSSKPIVLEVFTSSNDESLAYFSLLSENKEKTLKSSAKKIIKKLIK